MRHAHAHAGGHAHVHPAPAPASRGGLAALGAVIAALHAVGWGLVIWHAPRHPGFLGVAVVAYTLGLRHAFDADHIAAIDNTTRKLRQDGERSLTVGFFFSLGHATSVIALTAALALAASATDAALPGVSGIGGPFGAVTAGTFLWIIGLLNLAVLIDVARVARRMRRGQATVAEVAGLSTAGGLMTRLGLGRIFRRIGRPWQMFPLGLVFGLGFDTATEVAVLGLGAGAAASGLPVTAVMALPLLFAAGMAALDTADGVLMAHAYDWALREPARRVFYNLVVTLLSVTVALGIGTIELLQVAGDELGLHGGIWGWVADLDFQALGYVMVGLFVATWAGALVLWRVLRIEERWSAANQGRSSMPGPMVLLSSADTEILAAAHAAAELPAGFRPLRCANPLTHPEVVDELLAGRPGVVVCRLLGGRRAWPDGVAMLRERSIAERWPLVLLGGEAEADAELTALSTAPSTTVAEAFEYLRHGGVENTANLLRFLADTLLLEGHGFAAARELPDCSAWTPEQGDVDVATAVARCDPARPTVGVVFYRAHRATGNTAFVAALARAIEDAGANALCAWAYSLRPAADGRVPVLDVLGEHVDALVTTVLASGGSTAGDLEAGWRADALEGLGVPVIQALCVTTSRERWEASDSGLTPLDAAMQVAIPEFDGRIVGVPVSFKEPLDGAFDVGGEVLHYAPDLERCRRLARLAARHAGLRRLDPARARIAIVLSSFPTKHGRVGNAVGLDTPASAVALLDALREAGYDAGEPVTDGDALIHALIATGGHDQEFLTDEQLATAPARLPAADYAAWFGGLPQALQDKVVGSWGPPPGEWYLDGGDVVVAGLRMGNVFLAIQPPRGFGENPVAIYHDPALAPAHHYLAAYRWIESVFEADAIVHLGKHGTLEWLPGKALGLGAACAPDAAIGDVPFFYPFVVNDPGEGVQAKRRAHAVVIDHLVAPMMRAETYDELAELEQLLDEYARCEALDPPKLPALASRIWTVLHEAELHRDLGIETEGQPGPEEFGRLIEHVDGYLCEIKDLQVRDGLHVLGRVPEGEQLDGLLAAIMRLGAGERSPGLRRAIGAAFGLDEPALVDAPAAPTPAVPGALVARFPGPARSSGDLVDRLEDAQRALLAAFAARDHRPDEAEALCAEVLGHEDDGVVRALRFAGEEVVPRLRGTASELPNLVGGLQGRHVPAGPSGSPTRGRFDVLPTGRNFYSVDPKALPSELAYETGARLADALLERHVREEGAYPETVGMVVWGTAAMRTHGDDAGEVLALLGVRPVWHPETRRVVSLEPIDLDELGRPRIDVTLRISGFFRDAFPALVTLLDDAVALVAGLDEPVERNHVRKHVLEDVARLAGELDEKAAWRRATMRVFGGRPGTYGTGLLALLDAGNWREDADLAAVYEAWGGHAYGRGLDGVEAGPAMREQFARIAVAVKNVDTREHDLLDSGDYFAEHGGMVAFVRHLTGASPKAAIGDSSDPERVHARTLQEESRRVFRARVANPRWIASMIRHGYKGAFELSATVDYLFGYDATTGVVEDWMYEALAEKYVLDDDVRDFMRRSNPWALRAVAERLLEAADRELWAAPRPATLDALREAYLAVEDELEEATP
jgi:cobaltochelatase CobN